MLGGAPGCPADDLSCRLEAHIYRASQVMRANAGDIRDVGLIPGPKDSPGEGHGKPLQYSCLENPMNRGARRATVHGVSKSGTQVKQPSTQHVAHTQQGI